MKCKTTNREIKDNFSQIICVSYCKAQTLLRNRQPFAYKKGVLGWDYDAYDLGEGVALITGYRPFGNIKPDYQLLNLYEERARVILQEANCKSFELALVEVDELLNEFIDETLKKGVK